MDFWFTRALLAGETAQPSSLARSSPRPKGSPTSIPSEKKKLSKPPIWEDERSKTAPLAEALKDRSYEAANISSWCSSSVCVSCRAFSMTGSGAFFLICFFCFWVGSKSESGSSKVGSLLRVPSPKIDQMSSLRSVLERRTFHVQKFVPVLEEENSGCWIPQSLCQMHTATNASKSRPWAARGLIVIVTVVGLSICTFNTTPNLQRILQLTELRGVPFEVVRRCSH